MTVLAMIAACDSDPAKVQILRPELTVINGDTLGRGDAIRLLVKNGPLSPQTALDPANFVLTNQCNGLAIPGSLALAGDTLIFTPSQPLPFLIRVQARVQNLINTQGLEIGVPFVFSRITVAPPVSDVSWQFLTSPTQDAVTGTAFLDRNVGFITTQGGGVYKTINGGATFAAIFKSPDISNIVGLYNFGDTLYTNGVVASGGAFHSALLRSSNQGQSFTEAATLPAAFFYSLSMRRIAGTVVGLMGGQFSSPLVYRFDAPSTLVQGTGLPSTGVSLASVALSTDGNNAFAALYGAFGTATVNQGFLYVSRNGGRTFTSFSLGSGLVYRLGGGAFVDATTAIVGGDSSQVFRVNVATGVVQRLGTAQGIPKTGIDPISGRLVSYYFLKASFVPGTTIGWLVGIATVPPNVISGVILMTRDGGQTWIRQAISGAPDNGLTFPGTGEVQALAPDFAVLGGNGGLVAARKSDSQVATQVCSFNQP
ncbi:MAG: hypothetical protein M3081_21755 [Gemmatimonadota bacterium]|nr:hypothetical protein [Gemmatimonadota bacterium]